MATSLMASEVLISQKCRFLRTIVRRHKITHPCRHSSLGCRSYSIFVTSVYKSSLHKTPLFFPKLTLCRHLTVADNSSPVDSSHIEAAVTSQDLGGWTPVGILEQALDWLHVSIGLPWWGSIAVATLIARILMFPLFVKAQRNAITMNNNLPQVQVLQMKITEARKNRDAMEAARYSNELIAFMKEKNCNPFKSLLVPLAQAPVFVSFFFALREMATLPVESFKYGGALWFPDLTLTDPYYLLPVITSVTLFITIELNADGSVNTSATKNARYMMRAMPIMIFPFVITFPAAVLCYWVTSNGITLMQVGLLKIPKVRQLLKIPERIKHAQYSLPGKEQKGFAESFKEAWTNSQITREMQSRKQVEQMQLRKAGMGLSAKSNKPDSEKPKLT